MKLVVSAVAATLLVGGMGLAAFGPAFAQTTTPDAPAASAPSQPPDAQQGRWHAQRQNRGGDWGQAGRLGMRQMRGGGVLALACGDRGAEALEIALVHMYYRVKPTDTQQPLYDALKTAALADQKTFAASCKTAMDTGKGKPSILDRLEARLTLEQARVTALSDVVPKFKAFYDSLTPDQQQKLESARRGQGMHGMHQRGQHWQRPGGMQKPGDMGHGMKPATPTSPSADPASSST